MARQNGKRQAMLDIEKTIGKPSVQELVEWRAKRERQMEHAAQCGIELLTYMYIDGARDALNQAWSERGAKRAANASA